MKKATDPHPRVLVGEDDIGFFKTVVPAGGRWTIGPSLPGKQLGMSLVYALRVYAGRLNSSLIAFIPGCKWVRDESLSFDRPIVVPEKVLETLTELSGLTLMETGEMPKPKREAWVPQGVRVYGPAKQRS